MNDPYTHAVFVIEDNELAGASLHQQVKTLLQGLPFTVFCFSSVEEALQTKYYPALLLMDYDLKRCNKSAMNGLEGVNVLRKHFPAADFIMVTSEEETELFLRSREFAIYDYLLKDTHTNFRLGLTLDRWLKLHKYSVTEECPETQAKRA